jgi:hypothetical protein
LHFYVDWFRDLHYVDEEYQYGQYQLNKCLEEKKKQFSEVEFIGFLTKIWNTW